MISSSQSPLLSVTPVRCMGTANFINVEVWVCYSFSKHNIFSAKVKESFIVVWIIEEIRLENGQRVSSAQLSKTLSLSLCTRRQMQNGTGEVAEVSYYYYLGNSHENVWKFPCIEVAKFTDGGQTFWGVFPVALCGRFRTLRPAKG